MTFLWALATLTDLRVKIIERHEYVCLNEWKIETKIERQHQLYRGEIDDCNLFCTFHFFFNNCLFECLPIRFYSSFSGRSKCENKFCDGMKSWLLNVYIRCSPSGDNFVNILWTFDGNLDIMGYLVPHQLVF